MNDDSRDDRGLDDRVRELDQQVRELEQQLRTAVQALQIHRASAEKGRRRTDPLTANHLNERTENGVDVGYRGLQARAHGPLGVMALILLLLGGAVAYVNYQGFADLKVLMRQGATDHDLLACVMSLSPDDRTALRGATTRRDFQYYCPWLRTH